MPRLLLVSFALLAASLACTGGTSAPTDAAAVVQPAVLQPEDVTTVELRPFTSGPRLSGTLEPAERAVLRAETAGSIKAVQAEIGDEVRVGQLLARIDNSAVGSGFQSARAGMVSAQQDMQIATNELERVKTLVSHGALSDRDLELAQSQVASAGARLAAAKAQVSVQGEQVDATEIRSPIDGIVSQRSVGSGDVVSPGSALFTVIEPSSLRLEAGVPADAAAALRKGTSVQFTIQGFGDRPFLGTIERVAPAVDPASRQIPLLVSVPNEDGTLVAGLFAEGRVAVEQHDGLVVSVDAVDTTGPRPFVLRMSGNTVERVEVAVGRADEVTETIEIVSGVAAGDVLLLGAARDIAPGEPVELREPQAGR